MIATIFLESFLLVNVNAGEKTQQQKNIHKKKSDNRVYQYIKKNAVHTHFIKVKYISI
jgi:heme-degrading monooxygenase HmoA